MVFLVNVLTKIKSSVLFISFVRNLKTTFAFIVCFIYLFTQSATALSPEQTKVIQSGPRYFNVVDVPLCSTNTVANNNVTGDKVFYIGDSLTYHMVQGGSDVNKSGKLLQKTSASGYAVDTSYTHTQSQSTPRVSGHSVEAQGGISVAGSVQHLAEHPADFDKDHADIVVVGLGTNRETGETNDNTDEILGAQVDQIIASIRASNDPIIFWVNGYWTTPSSVKNVTWQAVNATLTKAAARDNFHILDYAAAAQADPVMAPGQYAAGGADGIHVDTVEGREKKSDWIISQLPKPGSASVPVSSPLTNPSGYDPTSLAFPAFPDENAIVSGIDNFIKSKAPSSPWLTMPGISSVGQWLVNESKTRNINPLFPVASGYTESTYGTASGGPPKSDNNYFGIKQGDNYRHFDSPELGIKYFMDAIQHNTQSTDSRYSVAKNIYEYFSIHQTGSIVYPGEDFDPQDKDTKPGVIKDLYDPSMNVWISWDPARNADNPNPRHRGQYTPLGYYKNNIYVINGVTGLSLPSDNPTRSGTAPTGGPGTCGGTAGQGNLDTTGYSFPLAPQTRAVGGIKVGQTTTMHHDGTPAFDLFSTDSAVVYAIYGGTPVNINNNLNNVPGCSSIQFKADDGFYYWYGHLKDTTVKEKVHIAAGTPMAKIADPKNYTTSCWGGGPHLHIDRGCVLDGVPQSAGVDDCRDPNFIPFLSKIYEGLTQ